MATIPPYYPALANKWLQPQEFPGGGVLGYGYTPGTSTFLILPTVSGSGVGTNPSGNVWMVYCGAGAYFPNALTGDVAIRNASARVLIGSNTGTSGNIPGIEYGASPASSTLTITSGTVYQPSTSRYALIRVSCYATTSGTAGSIAIARGASSTPTAEAGTYVSGATSSTACARVEFTVPASWYWSATLSGVTIESAEQILM